jgi:hypothetical protein
VFFSTVKTGLEGEGQPQNTLRINLPVCCPIKKLRASFQSSTKKQFLSISLSLMDILTTTAFSD